MQRTIVTTFIVASCLALVLACPASAWGIHTGLVRPPTGMVRIGNFEAIGFTGVQFSTARPPRGYYTVWVVLRDGSAMRPRMWRPLIWAYRLLRLEVPPNSAR